MQLAQSNQVCDAKYSRGQYGRMPVVFLQAKMSAVAAYRPRMRGNMRHDQ